jgi:UDP-N-acetylmuramate dehydrogenase
MSLNILNNQPLANHTTMRLGGPAKYFVNVTTEDELVEAVKYAKEHRANIITIGDGSNIIFKDSGFDGMVIHISIDGISIDNLGNVTAKAGTNWDQLVGQTVDQGFCGIEGLSLIPGTVGGAPVNNIGAYGQEISESITGIKAYDTKNQIFTELLNEECQFKYRNSIFKSDLHGRFIITDVNLKLALADTNYTPPAYGSLQSVISDQHISNPNIRQVRNIVCAIRETKLPNPALIANCGSFFKNPIVPKALFEGLIAGYPKMPYFENPNGIKLAAGWLIEQAGLKGFSKDGIRVYEKQALVLINDGTKSFKSLENMYTHIQELVNEKFGVQLEPEPEIIG